MRPVGVDEAGEAGAAASDCPLAMWIQNGEYLVGISVGHRLVEIMQAGGITAVFGVPGGQTLPLYRGAREQGLRHVLMRDERAAACAADAYARLTGKVGVCDATAGPGVTNIVSGVAEAYASSIPTISLIAGVDPQMAHLMRRSVHSQAVDQPTLLSSITKWVGTVERPEALDDMFDHALRVATTGRPGPVALELTAEVFAAQMPDKPSGRTFGPKSWTYPRYRSAPSAEALAQAVEVLAQAKRPLILAGGGVSLGGASAAVSAMAEELQIPVVTTISGKGSIDERSPLAGGVTGIFGSMRGNAAARAADVVLVLGSKLGQFSTHRWQLPSPGQTVVHVDVDGEEIGRAIPVAVGVVADAGEAATALAAALRGKMQHGGNWLPTLDPGKAPGTAPDDPRVAPEAVARAIGEMLEPGDVLVTDASLSSGWAAAHSVLKGTGRLFAAPRGLAGIGWSGGAAIGARAAVEPPRRVVVLAGDGGWAYGLSEVETAARMGMDITYVVLNNSAFGWIKHIEDRQGITPPSTLTDVDFAAVARPMGAGGNRVSDLESFQSELARGLAHNGPYVIDVLSAVDSSPIVTFEDVPRVGVYV